MFRENREKEPKYHDLQNQKRYVSPSQKKICIFFGSAKRYIDRTVKKDSAQDVTVANILWVSYSLKFEYFVDKALI